MAELIAIHSNRSRPVVNGERIGRLEAGLVSMQFARNTRQPISLTSRYCSNITIHEILGTQWYKQSSWVGTISTQQSIHGDAVIQTNSLFRSSFDKGEGEGGEGKKHPSFSRPLRGRPGRSRIGAAIREVDRTTQQSTRVGMTAHTTTRLGKDNEEKEKTSFSS